MDDPQDGNLPDYDPAISFRPLPGDRERLRDLAHAKGCTVASLVRRAVHELVGPRAGAVRKLLDGETLGRQEVAELEAACTEAAQELRALDGTTYSFRGGGDAIRSCCDVELDALAELFAGGSE